MPPPFQGCNNTCHAFFKRTERDSYATAITFDGASEVERYTYAFLCSGSESEINAKYDAYCALDFAGYEANADVVDLCSDGGLGAHAIYSTRSNFFSSSGDVARFGCDLGTQARKHTIFKPHTHTHI